MEYRATSFLRTAAWALLVALYGIALVGAFGYGFFTLNPQNLAAYPSAAEIYGHTFSAFAQGQIWLAGLALILYLHASIGLRWLLPLVLISSIGFVSEYFGTSVGIPFGNYEYTALLGSKLAGKVPPVIPFSWFFMGVTSYLLAGLMSRSMVGRIVAGAVILTSWDLVLDPAMSRLTQYWVWEDTGIYYGTPLVNFGGWFLTGAVIMMICELLLGEKSVRRIPPKYLLGFYGANLLLPVAMCLLAGLWLALGLTVLAYLCCYLWALSGMSRSRHQLGLETAAAGRKVTTEGR